MNKAFDEIKKLFYFAVHGLFGCPDSDMEDYKDCYSECKKCGRYHFTFKQF